MEYEELTTFASIALSKHDSSHGMPHALAVITNLQRLAPRFMSAPRFRKIAIFAAMLHDVFDHKYEGKTPITRDDMCEFLVAQLGLVGCAVVLHIHANMSFTKSRKHPEQIIPFRYPLFEEIRIAVRDSDWIERINVPRSVVYNEHLIMAKSCSIKPSWVCLRPIIVDVVLREMIPVLFHIRAGTRAHLLAADAVLGALEWLKEHP